MIVKFPNYNKIWCVDFEFYGAPGERPTPICYVATDILSGKTIRQWLPEPKTQKNPPEFLSENSLFIAYFASAEVGCLLSLNLNPPLNIVDLFCEFRVLTNGKLVPAGDSLLGACTYFGIGGGDATYKELMRTRVLEGPPYSDKEKVDILDYCEIDVKLTIQLFNLMVENINLKQALLRGRYMSGVGKMEFYGIPIDMVKFNLLKKHWDFLKDQLISRIDQNYGVYENGVFKTARFSKYLLDHNIPWETTPTGLPRLDEAFFKEQAKAFPKLKPLQELRYSLSQLKLNKLQIGLDGRNRALISPFRAVTSRNQPSSSKFIFGNAVWLRNLIKPEEGKALAYVDYSQQEIGIAAVLSGDQNLINSYLSGDPYIEFAKLSGAVPKTATKDTHPDEREQFKTCMLGMNYGMQENSFARKTNLSLSKASEIFQLNHIIYRRYWEWISEFIDKGYLSGSVSTRFGWKAFTKNMPYRTLQNFPMQAHGGDILRLAICLCLEYGVKVLAPIHDALLIEAPNDEIELAVRKTQWCMTEASRYVINFPISTDFEIIRYPDHYTSRRGELMWNTVWEIINEREFI